MYEKGSRHLRQYFRSPWLGLQNMQYNKFRSAMFSSFPCVFVTSVSCDGSRCCSAWWEPIFTNNSNNAKPFKSAVQRCVTKLVKSAVVVSMLSTFFLNESNNSSRNEITIVRGSTKQKSLPTYEINVSCCWWEKLQSAVDFLTVGNQICKIVLFEKLQKNKSFFRVILYLIESLRYCLLEICMDYPPFPR